MPGSAPIGGPSDKRRKSAHLGSLWYDMRPLGEASFRQHGGSRTRFWAACSAALGGLLLARSAHGGETASSRWKGGPLHEEVTVREWLTACGPAPASRTHPDDEEFDVSNDGGELTFRPTRGVGTPSPRAFATNVCYESLPALSQESHTFDSKTKTWRTRCATPSGDPRRIVVQTLVTAEGTSRMSLAETVHYEITVAEGTCIADVKRTRTFSIASGESVRNNASGGLAVVAPTPAEPRTPAASSSRTWFSILVFGSAAVLAALWGALVLQKRRTARREAIEHQRRTEERRREREERVRAATGAKADQARAARAALREARAHAGPMSCPTCKREFANELSFCPYDANRLVPLNEARKNGPPGGICPACKRGFNPGVTRCPHDDEELVPYVRGVNEVDDETPQGVICPTCSQKSDGKGGFCVRDGTPLAPLN